MNMRTPLSLDAVPTTSDALYRRDLLSCGCYSEEQQQVLVQQAQMGLQDARTALLEHCLPYVARLARRFAATYQAEVMELIAIGNATLVEYLDTALTKEQWRGWLFATIRYKLLHATLYGRDLIARGQDSKGNYLPAYVVESVDRPLSEDSHETLADMLEAPCELNAASRDYSALYQAMERLTPKRQQVIKHYFGLETHAPLHDPGVAQALGYKRYSQVTKLRREAIEALRMTLQADYPAYAQETNRYSETLRRARERKNVRRRIGLQEGKVCQWCKQLIAGQVTARRLYCSKECRRKAAYQQEKTHQASQAS